MHNSEQHLHGQAEIVENNPTHPNTAERPVITVLLCIALLLPAVAAFLILYKQALPVPFIDDYHTILAFADQYKALPTLEDKVLKVAATQYNEYKLVLQDTVVASELELTHHLNFTFLTIVTNLFLLPTAYLLWRAYKSYHRPLNYQLLEFVPISILFFSLSYWEDLNWTTGGLNFLPSVFFSFLAIYCITSGEIHKPSRGNLILGCLAAALASFSSANGFLLGPIGLLILLPRQAYVRAFAWCASFFLPLSVYLYHYAPVPHPLVKRFYIAIPLFFLRFLGGEFFSHWTATRLMAVLLGLGILVVLGTAVRSRFDRNNPAAFYFTVWIVATACLAAWVRGGSGLEVASRYAIYCNLLLIFCYAFLLQHFSAQSPSFNRRRFVNLAIALATINCFLVDGLAYEKLRDRREMVLSGIESYRLNPDINSPLIDPAAIRAFPGEQDFERTTLSNAIQTQLYTLPPRPTNYNRSK